MNIPITFGGPQLVLLLIAVAGVGLLIYAVMGLRGHPVRDRDMHGKNQPYKRRRHFRWGHGFGGLLLVALALSLLWLTFLVQTYLGLTSDIKVAQIHATKIEGLPHTMSVEIVMYDQSSNPTSDHTYLVQGDEWMLQGDIIKFPAWLNILGLHSGYKLTRLEGRFDDPNLERNSQHTVIELNGGDDNFFKTVQQQAWVNPMIEAAYGNAVFLGADGKTYNAYASQTGLYAKPAK